MSVPLVLGHHGISDSKIFIWQPDCTRCPEPVGAVDEVVFASQYHVPIAGLPSHVYSRALGLQRGQTATTWRAAPSTKRGNTLHKRAIAVDQCNTHWCSDARDIACDIGARGACRLARYNCNRRAISQFATTAGIIGKDSRDLQWSRAAPLRPVNRPAETLERLTANGSSYKAVITRRSLSGHRLTTAYSPGQIFALARIDGSLRAHPQTRLHAREPAGQDMHDPRAGVCLHNYYKLDPAVRSSDRILHVGIIKACEASSANAARYNTYGACAHQARSSW
jgi:hypothetical protein